jgi:hypothetical protein
MNNNNNNKAILYYSKRCAHCGELLNKIREGEKMISGFSNNFLYVLVDGNQNLPKYITEVPTMVVPTHNKPLTGDSVFMWVDTKLRSIYQQAQQQQQQQTQQRTAPQQQQQVQQQQQQEADGPMCYNPLEMSGFGDSFSFLDGMGDVQEHCFTFIDENGQRQTKCVPSGGQIPQQQQQQQQIQAPPGMAVPDWLKPQNVGRTQSNGQQQQLQAQSYNPNIPGGVTMSQQNNIRLQEQARMNSMGGRQIPNFQDPGRQPMNDNSKISDQDYERFMASRNNDPSIQSAAQRI